MSGGLLSSYTGTFGVAVDAKIGLRLIELSGDLVAFVPSCTLGGLGSLNYSGGALGSTCEVEGIGEEGCRARARAMISSGVASVSSTFTGGIAGRSDSMAVMYVLDTEFEDGSGLNGSPVSNDILDLGGLSHDLPTDLNLLADNRLILSVSSSSGELRMRRNSAAASRRPSVDDLRLAFWPPLIPLAALTMLDTRW